MNERQRDDLRRQSDHIGNLEASNRQLLDAIPRNNTANFDVAKQDPDAQYSQLKLRAVSEI
jgi:hypothetical protein